MDKGEGEAIRTSQGEPAGKGGGGEGVVAEVDGLAKGGREVGVVGDPRVELHAAGAAVGREGRGEGKGR